MPLTRAEILKLRSLRERRGRREHGLYLAEGIRLLEEALRHGKPASELYIVPERLGERGAALAESYRAAGTEVVGVTDRELERFADAKSPQGAIAVFRVPTLSLDGKGGPETHPRVLLLDGIADPGNAGTLLRSALAFGFGLVLLTESSADPFSPKVVRSSAGAVFGLELARAPADTILAWIAAGGYELAVAIPSSREPSADELGTSRPLVLAIGAEAQGLDPRVATAAQTSWGIEHGPGVESLNAAVAGSILMHAVYKTRAGGF